VKASIFFSEGHFLYSVRDGVLLKFETGLKEAYWQRHFYDHSILSPAPVIAWAYYRHLSVVDNLPGLIYGVYNIYT
jgi:hypothetical protein